MPSPVVRRFTGLLALMALACCLAPAWPWANGAAPRSGGIPFGTHDWLAWEAVQLLPEQSRWWLVQNDDALCLGTSAPDNKQDATGFADVEDYQDRPRHHVYFSIYGPCADFASALRVLQEYDEALAALSAGNHREAAFHVGAMTHYFCDIAVWAHLMGQGSDLPSEEDRAHSFYEEGVDKTITPKYAKDPVAGRDSTVFSRYLAFDGQLEFLYPIEATLRLACVIHAGPPGGLSPARFNEVIDTSIVSKWPESAVRTTGLNMNTAINGLADLIYSLLLDAELLPAAA